MSFNQPISTGLQGISNPLTTPVAQPNQLNKPSATVADASSAIYSAAMKTGLTDQESKLIEQWAFINKTHKELMGLPNADAAKKYNSLSTEVQGALQAYYSVDYANKVEENSLIQNQATRKILGLDNGFGIGDFLKSPLRGLMSLGAEYGRIINTPGNLVQMQMQQGGVIQDGKIPTAILDQAHDGIALYDPRYADPLIQKYGGERSFVAMKLLAGMTPGEIIDAWGPNDPNLLVAISEAFNNTSSFQDMLSEFERAQISPGRTIAHEVNKNLHIDEKLFGGKVFSVGSGLIDMAYQIFADPLTYLSFGGTAILKGIGKAEKGAELFTGVAKSVERHFADPKNKELWTGLSEELGKYRAAADSGDMKAAAEIRTNIKNVYPQFSNDSFIELATTGEKAIKDLPSAIDFFTSAENTSKLVRLRINGITYAREGAATMRTSRNLGVGIRMKTREIFQGKTDFNALDNADVDTLIKELTVLGDSMDGGYDTTALFNVIDKNAKKGIRASIEKLSARFPGHKAIFTADEKYRETLDLIREQAFVALGDKRMAEIVAIKYANLPTQMERVALRKALDEVTMRRMGMDKVSGGLDKMTEILNSKYGVTLKDNAYAAGGTLKVPSRFDAAGVVGKEKPVTGPLLPFQNTDAIGGLPWREIKEFMASKSLQNPDDKGVQLAAKFIGGAFNRKFVNNLTDVWTTFTLAPRLGIRTAIDEGFMFGMYMTTGLAREFINAKRAGNILTSYLGTTATTGPVKNFLQHMLSKAVGKPVGAARSISIDLRNDVRKFWVDEFKVGRIQEWEIDKKVNEEIFDMAISRFGKRLSPERQQWLKEAALTNPRMIDDVSSRQLGSVLSGRAGIVTGATPLLTETELTKAMNALGYITKDNYEIKAAQGLEDHQLLLAMYHNFYTAFGTKPYKFTDGSFVSPANLFIKHNGIADAADYAKFEEDFMLGVGFIKDKGNWIVGNQKKIDEFLSQSRQTLNRTGATQQDLALNFIEDTASELSYRLHGSVDGYNKDIVDHFKSQAKADGTPMPVYMTASDMSFETYSDLMKNHLAKDMIRTNIDFGLRTRNLGAWASRYGQDKIFEAMARTTDDLFRQPVVHAHYFLFRKQYAELEKTYEQQLFDGMDKAIPESTRRRRSKEIANKYFVEQSLEDAVHHTLKYSDNPEVRSMFAENMRTVGRFYRAVEDFQRRMYRLYKDRGLSAVYKARMMNQGLSAIGQVHTDPDGKSYLVLPMDDAIFHAVDTTLRALSRGRLGVNQPLYNDITFKISAGNPSFQDDAGVPYLSGPMGALSVMGLKAVMQKFDPLKSGAEDLDNFMLGNIGDNMTLRKAIIPKGLEQVWNLMSYDEKSQQEVTATMQAISYNQANGYGVYPDDPKYKNPDGTVDEVAFQKDLEQYRKDVQITAHNVLWLRNMLGLISPMAPVLQETKDLPSYMKNAGLSGMKASLQDVLQSVEKMYPTAQDHYELALATWTGGNPGKLAYLVSRNDAEANVVMTYSNQMQDWLLKHDSLVKDYGNAAVLFAPHVGQFSSGVYNWAKAADLIKSRTVEDYLNEVTMQDSMNQYFDITNQETEAVKNAALPSQRSIILGQFAEKKRQMLLTTPTLEDKVSNIANNEAKAKFINNVQSIINDSSVDIDPAVRTRVRQAFDIYNNFMYQVDSNEVRSASNSAEVKRNLKAAALQKLEALSKEDDTKVVEQLIRISFKGLMNSKSRDAQNTIR